MDDNLEIQGMKLEMKEQSTFLKQSKLILFSGS